PGVEMPDSRARCRKAAISSAPCIGPSPTTRSSKASIHSATSSENFDCAGTASLVSINPSLVVYPSANPGEGARSSARLNMSTSLPNDQAEIIDLQQQVV